MCRWCVEGGGSDLLQGGVLKVLDEEWYVCGGWCLCGGWCVEDGVYVEGEVWRLICVG